MLEFFVSHSPSRELTYPSYGNGNSSSQEGIDFAILAHHTTTTTWKNAGWNFQRCLQVGKAGFQVLQQQEATMIGIFRIKTSIDIKKIALFESIPTDEKISDILS